ncbi:uncharacterized protein LOC143296913 [Babylonia areolata]|uniref:uncharacterized protein LOC143296913 n=1 Tax=Babylonia areolata TaxID=304850 RepID=UPI003FCF78C9
MAYDQHYRPASQNSVFGLCSSHSYLDGVPFKISSTFRPHAQPQLPPELLHASKPCQALHEEYAFDTEEAVLAWARAREEAKVKAMAAKEAAAKAAQAAAECSTSKDSGENSGSNGKQSGSAENAVKTSEPEVKAVKPPWQLPVGAASLSSSILTPTPIQSFQKKAQSPLVPTNPVDLALFEQEDDPFDNMELQTINDMEELRTLLGGAVDGNSQDPSPNPDSQTLKTVNGGEDTHVNQTPSQDSVSVKSTVASSNVFTSIPGVKMFESKSSDSVSCSTVPSNMNKTDSVLGSSSGTTVDTEADNDYVKIRSDYSQQSVHFQRDCSPVNNSHDGVPGLGGELPQQFADSKAFKPVLPPIRPRGKSVGEGALDGAAAGSLMSSSVSCVTQSSVPHPHHRHSFVGVGMSQSAYAMSTSASGAVDMPVPDFPLTSRHPGYTHIPGSQSRPVDVAASSGYNLYSRHYHNAGSGSPSPVNGVGANRAGLRSAKSNPDLPARGHSPHGSRPNSSSQPWNPYTPLPPTPVPDLPPSSHSPEGLSADRRQTPSPSPRGHTPSPQPPSSSGAVPGGQPDHDPYASLSSEAKTFVNNLTSMGFPRSRVSRAVEKFGVDEREVLDHLLNVDKLVEKKFTPGLAETSLHLFKNDICKAERFLSLYHQFTELGFTGDRIQTALVRHELDRDKALDYLTT